MPEPQPTTLPDRPQGAAQAPAAAFDFDARFHTQFELARGGMGRVLVAQDAVLGREVAIKELLKKENAGAMRRFEREALLTARLQHPGIVSVYEFARRASGEPVLVMRRVEGDSFEDAIAEARSLEKRLALLSAFTSACDAVAYAHQQGVIHRDLKPGNVLLGSFGDTVVIDWGLAKQLSDTAPESEPPGEDEPTSPGFGPPLTAAGSVFGTPSYMSPEQARGEPADARSDVYALGAMLYHLLSGRRPYQGLDTKEVLEAVRSGPPPLLTSIVPGLAPELATIVGRATARDPRDRYPNARELAEELKRFQTGRLVLSHTYGTRELVARWARRHAALLAVSSIFLVGWAVFGALALRRIVAERDRANREAEVSRRVSDFVTGMFRVANPSEARGNTVTAREILDKAAAGIESGLAQDALIRARLMKSIGTVYYFLGLYQQAQQFLEKALEINRRELGPENRETLQLAYWAGTIAWRRGRLVEGESMLRQVVETQQRILGPEDPDTLDSLEELGWTFFRQEKREEAENIFARVLDARRRALGPDHPSTVTAMAELAVALGDDPRRLPEVEKIEQQVLDVRRRLLGGDHPQTLLAINNLAATHFQQGKFAESASALRGAVEVEQRVLGSDHPDTLRSRQNLSRALFKLGKSDEAEKNLREVIEIKERVLGRAHPDTLAALVKLGAALQQLGRRPEAERLYLEVVARWRSGGGPAGVEVGNALYNLGHAAAVRGDRSQALDYLRQSGAILGPSSADDMAEDADLASLRDDPQFEKMLLQIKKAAAPAR